VFYKNFILHGLNISLALCNLHRDLPPPLAVSPSFRLFWLLLNTAYVMEFFLQTLVKKGHLQQQTMLAMQMLLMLTCSLSAAGASSPFSPQDVHRYLFPQWLLFQRCF
jgi:hypothetical protein